MGYKNFESLEGSNGEDQSNTMTLSADTLSVELPDVSFVKDAEISRDGMDLVLDSPDGQVIVDGYFAQIEPPTLVAPDGSSLSPQLVNSFVKSSPLYADNASMSDESPIGAIQEINGDATVTRTDGSSETLQLGSPIYQGDIVETGADGAVNIMFIDETSFAVSEDARLAIDEYVFDPATAEGVTNFSVLKGMFVFTSGMIGREDPDDVQIETPMGSIGIRGTIIAGDVNSGEITVVEGAIVLRNPAGMEMTLANQYETARFDVSGGEIQNMGQMAANDMAQKFVSISNVSPQLFSSIDDTANAAQENTTDGTIDTPQNNDGDQRLQENQDPSITEEGSENKLDANNDGSVDGTVDENNDGSADGTIEQPIELKEDGTTEDRSDILLQEDGTIKEVTLEGSTPKTTDGKIVQDANIVDNQTTQVMDTNPLADHSGLKTAIKTSIVDNKVLLSNTDTTTIKAALAGTSTLNTMTLGTKTTASTDTTTQFTTITRPIIGSAFKLNVQTFSFQENDSSNPLVAKITSTNGLISSPSLSLVGPAASMFNIVDDGAGGFDVYLNVGTSLNFETPTALNALGITATSTDGQTSSAAINLNLQNQDELVQDFGFLSNTMLNASEGIVWRYDFRQDFNDEDSGLPTISMTNLTTLQSQLLSDGVINSNTDATFVNGVLQINFNNNFGTNSSVNINITASDGTTTPTTGTYTLNYQDAPDAFSVNGFATSTQIMSAGNTAITGANTFSILGNNNEIYFSNFDDDGSITVTGNTNELFMNNGNDQITISSNAINNQISGGNGNDEFHILDVKNEINGDSGNDVFIFDLDNGVNIMADLLTGSGVNIDGNANGSSSLSLNLGSRTLTGNGDKIYFTGDGAGNPAHGDNINFSNILDAGSQLKNIEIIDVTNSDNNNIILGYQDIFDMTDHKNTLVIRGDTNDNITIDAEFEATHQLQGTQISDGTDTYNTYFIGDVTLLIDTQITIDNVNNAV